MVDVVIFGIRDFAELSHYYFETDTDLNVAAFSVSQEFIPKSRAFMGLPVVPFENVEDIYPPDEFMFFAPMSAARMNQVRKEIYIEVKRKGYQCANYVSSRATVLGEIVGDNCFILEDNTIQPFTQVGSNVVLWSGNHIGHHGIIEDHVTFTAHVVMSGNCRIRKQGFFGVNSTIRDGLDVAEGTFLAMASALVSNTDPWSAYKGNPAEKLRIPSTKIKF